MESWFCHSFLAYGTAFSKDAKLDQIKGMMHSSDEKWTVETALDLQTTTPVIAMSLMMIHHYLTEDMVT